MTNTCCHSYTQWTTIQEHFPELSKASAVWFPWTHLLMVHLAQTPTQNQEKFWILILSENGTWNKNHWEFLEECNAKLFLQPQTDDLCSPNTVSMLPTLARLTQNLNTSFLYTWVQFAGKSGHPLTHQETSTALFNLEKISCLYWLCLLSCNLSNQPINICF